MSELESIDTLTNLSLAEIDKKWKEKSASIDHISKDTRQGRERRASELHPYGEASRIVRERIASAWSIVACIKNEFAREAAEADVMKKIHPEFRKVLNNVPLGNLVFSGNTGLGKSLSAAIIIRRRGIPKGVWVQVRDISESARQWPLGKGENPVVEEASNAPVLVLDDLGIEKDHGCLIDVLERRYSRGLPTITTTGLNYDGLIGRYGDAIVRRLRESGGRRGLIVVAE